MFSVRHLLALSFAVIALAGGGWFIFKSIQGPRDQPQFATVLPEHRPLPEFSLTDHENRAYTPARLRGRTSLLFFGFTHCPDICPATLQQLATARQRLAGAAPRGDTPRPQIVLVSVDPERDTPAKLRRFVEYFGDDITGVTGTVEEIRRLTTPLGVFFERQGAGDDYTVSHSTAVLVIDRDATLQALFSAPHSVDAFVHDLPLLMTSQ